MTKASDISRGAAIVTFFAILVAMMASPDTSFVLQSADPWEIASESESAPADPWHDFRAPDAPTYKATVPLPKEKQAALDRYLGEMWNADCSCWKVMHKGVLGEMYPPIGKYLSRQIYDMMQRGELHFIDPRNTKGI